MAKEINLFEPDLFDDSNHSNVAEAEVTTTPQQSPIKSDENIAEVLHTLAEKHQQQQIYTQLRTQAKRIIEALLFASSEPLTLQRIREVIDPIHPFKPKIITEIIEELEMEYHSQQRAFQLEEIAQGYILRTRKEFGPYIEQLLRNKRGEKLSQAATEVLAIIAYRQPITRPHIDAVRGVDSSGIIQSLLERQLIESVGKLEAPGRPTLYGITKDFLKHFGLKDIKDLPKIAALNPQAQKEQPIQQGPAKEG